VTEIECTGVHQQSLQDVLVAVDVRVTQATGFVEMRAGAPTSPTVGRVFVCPIDTGEV